MNKQRGRYIAIEGGEGVGKTTQAELIIERLADEGIDAVYIQEPGSAPFAQELRKLLKFGPQRSPLANVMTFNAARAETILEIEAALSSGKWVISDRSYLSTIAYQGYGEGQDIDMIRTICEYAMGKTRPDLIVLLEVKPEVAAMRIQKRNKGGDYFEDMNSQFHDKLREGFRKEALLSGFPIVDAEGSVENVFSDIWQHVDDLVHGKIDSSKESGVFLKKTKEGQSVTAEGHKELARYLTDSKGDVYAFNGSLEPSTVAAAMARLSRRGDDMRITLLDEFLGQTGKDEDLLKRVITAYGDDSVQQLVGIHLVVENASNLLTKKLEWGRLAAYLEQSTRYIYFDKKDSQGKYKYYTPKTFDAETEQLYTRALDSIFEAYSNIVHNLTEHIQLHSKVPEEERDGAWRAACRAQACDAARPLLPVATKSTVGIFGSGQAIESLIMHLMSDELDECRTTGESMLKEARKVMPAFLERADRPDRGGAMVAYRANTRSTLGKLSTDKLPAHSLEYEPVKLLAATPRNELDLVPYMLYETSSLSFGELRQEVDQWSVEEKINAFETYVGERLNRRHKPGRALEHAHYTFDLVCDYGIFRDLQRHRMVDGLEWQELTPRYGFDVPKLVDDAGMTDIYEKCFEMSFLLYDSLRERGYEKEAQYATLLGHRMRWKIMYNAREAFHLHELRTSPQGHPGYRKLVGQMHEAVSEVHPMLASAMKFVNQGEDPELARLAAEKYTQFKLAEMDKQKSKK